MWTKPKFMISAESSQLQTRKKRVAPLIIAGAIYSGKVIIWSISMGAAGVATGVALAYYHEQQERKNMKERMATACQIYNSGCLLGFCWSNCGPRFMVCWNIYSVIFIFFINFYSIIFIFFINFYLFFSLLQQADWCFTGKRGIPGKIKCSSDMDCNNCSPRATQCYVEGQKVILDDPLDTKNLEELKRSMMLSN